MKSLYEIPLIKLYKLFCWIKYNLRADVRCNNKNFEAQHDVIKSSNPRQKVTPVHMDKLFIFVTNILWKNI